MKVIPHYPIARLRGWARGSDGRPRICLRDGFDQFFKYCRRSSCDGIGIHFDSLGDEFLLKKGGENSARSNGFSSRRCLNERRQCACAIFFWSHACQVKRRGGVHRSRDLQSERQHPGMRIFLGSLRAHRHDAIRYITSFIDK